MINNYSLSKYKSFLNFISIDIWYVLPDEFKEEYYSQKIRYVENIEWVVDPDNGRLHEGGTAIWDVWDFGFNKLKSGEFFHEYSILEKNLLDEISINFKIMDDPDNVEGSCEEFCKWLNDKISQVIYNVEKDTFQCDFIEYCDLFKKITFKENYNIDVYQFHKILKERLIQTYSLILDKIPLGIYKPNLKWKGNDTDLIDLLTALWKNESVIIKEGKTTWKALTKQFEQIFGIEIKDTDSKKSKTTIRKEDGSIFLDQLQAAYTKNAIEKINKRRK